MSEMVERVAKAMLFEMTVSWGGTDGFSDALYERPEKTLSDLSEAAIEAMRDPTDEVLLAGQSDPNCERPTILTAESLITRWQAMIDAALGDAKE